MVMVRERSLTQKSKNSIIVFSMKSYNWKINLKVGDRATDDYGFGGGAGTNSV